MEAFRVVLVLMLAVVVSGAVSRMNPFPIPRPLVQIAFGAAITLVADFRVKLDPELFFLLFLPPLLFLDGWRLPRDELHKDRILILELALGLVVLTVLVIGFLVHLMLPAVPLAVAFALAAVISPTDPIAVGAIARRTRIPRRMMRILEGESLLNDASGLVCLRFAVAAMLSGGFSLGDATLTFFWIASGGIIVGTAVTWTIVRVKDWVSRHFGEESGSQILISLLIPFGCYLLAEELHCSGILAAVAAGVTMSVTETSGRALPVTRIRRNTVWDMIQFAGNGMLFVLLGEQLPSIVGGAAAAVQLTGHENPWWLLAYVFAINVGLAILRFVWVWVSLQLTLFRAGQRFARPDWRIVAAMCFAGVRGTITLAGVLTLPLTMTDGSPFPARELVIALAAAVIIISLVVATVALPLLLRGLRMPDEPSSDVEEDAALVAAAESAIAAIERRQHAMASGRKDADLYIAAAARITDLYRDRIASRQEGSAADQTRHNEVIERDLRLTALQAERAEIFHLARVGKIGSHTASKLVRELDLLETRLGSG